MSEQLVTPAYGQPLPPALEEAAVRTLASAAASCPEMRADLVELVAMLGLTEAAERVVAARPA